MCFIQMESPPQQAGASVDALYSLVVSVKSSQDIHEVYIDAHFRNTALKVHTCISIIPHLSIQLFTIAVC